MDSKHKLRKLKIKLANLQIEIQSLIEKGDKKPELIDAIADDISGFTDEVTKICREIENVKSKQNESISLMELYKNIKKK